MDSEPDRGRPAHAAAPAALDRGEPPRPSEPAAEAKLPSGTEETEETGQVAFEDGRVREAVAGGMAIVFLIVGGLGAFWFWNDASSPNLIWTAIWQVFWPWGLLATIAGGLLLGMLSALRISRESEDGPIESGEALAVAAFALWGVARGFLKEAGEDGRFVAKALVVVAAIVLLLLVFEPSILEEIERWLERNL